MLYLAKGHRRDKNNGPGVTRIVPLHFGPAFNQLNSNNDPSPGHSNLGSDGRYTCSLMDSWWVPYLLKSYRPDFNQEVTRIVALYWPPQRLFEFDSNNDSSPSHSNLVSDRVLIHLFMSHTYGFLVGAISAQALQA